MTRLPVGAKVDLLAKRYVGKSGVVQEYNRLADEYRVTVSSKDVWFRREELAVRRS